MSRKFMKGAFFSQYEIILKVYFQNFSVVLGKISVHNIVWYESKHLCG